MNNNSNKYLNIIHDNSVFWSRLGFAYDPPRLDENGKPILYTPNFEPHIKYQKDFFNAGIKVISSILNSGWIGCNNYDYEVTDKVLDAIFQANPEAYYIPRIKLNVPIDWCAENPEDVFVYYGGPGTAAEIRSLIGTKHHDLPGYGPSIYGAPSELEHDKPYNKKLISLQSFSSTKWLTDAGEALRRIINYIECGPYAERIPAYHIAYGVCGETSLWGWGGKGQDGLSGDWGINNCKAFFDWGINKYGSLEVLRDVWRNHELTRNNTEPPLPALRQGQFSSPCSLLRSRPEDIICVDYDIFTSEINVAALEYFGKVVKENTDSKPVGGFYGYILECPNSAYTGWLAYEKILNSPYIDFIAAPKSYYRNGPGEPGGESSPAQSINRQKMWMDELDIRTHLGDDSKCNDFSETRSVLWREFAKNLAHGSNYWWMDLKGGWFDSPEIMQEIAIIEDKKNQFKNESKTGIAEILLVIDEESFAYLSPEGGLHGEWHFLVMLDFVREAYLCGSPVDIFRLNDLGSLDVSNYKLVFFLNCFKVTSSQKEMIRNKFSETNVIVWFYLSGALNPEYSIDNVCDLTGFPIEESAEHFSYPRINFNDSSPFTDCQKTVDRTGGERRRGHLIKPANMNLPGVKVKKIPNTKIWGTFANGETAVAARHEGTQTQVYFALPIMRGEHVRALAEMAACNLYAPASCTVYGDNRFISVFPAKAMEFSLKLPKYVDAALYPDKQQLNYVNEINLKLDSNSDFRFINIKDSTPLSGIEKQQLKKTDDFFNFKMEVY